MGKRNRREASYGKDSDDSESASRHRSRGKVWKTQTQIDSFNEGWNKCASKGLKGSKSSEKGNGKGGGIKGGNPNEDTLQLQAQVQQLQVQVQQLQIQVHQMQSAFPLFQQSPASSSVPQSLVPGMLQPMMVNQNQQMHSVRGYGPSIGPSIN